MPEMSSPSWKMVTFLSTNPGRIRLSFWIFWPLRTAWESRFSISVRLVNYLMICSQYSSWATHLKQSEINWRWSTTLISSQCLHIFYSIKFKDLLCARWFYGWLWYTEDKTLHLTPTVTKNKLFKKTKQNEYLFFGLIFVKMMVHHIRKYRWLLFDSYLS